MKKGHIYILSGASIGLLLAIRMHFRHRKQNQLAGQLLRNIEQLLRPQSAGLLAEDAFDIYYVDNLRGSVSGSLILLQTAAAHRFASDIYSSFSFWNDDEQRIFSVFRSLKDKAQVSQVAAAYQSKYHANLIDVLSDQLNESEVTTILTIIRNLPNYRTR